MTAHDLMTSPVRACTPQTSLAAAGVALWDNDCGVLPVVDTDRRLLGMITDRDICIAGATRGLRLDAIDVMTTNVVTCGTSASVDEIVEKMATNRVRRLPVVDAEGEVVGIVSLNDLALRAHRDKKHNGVTNGQVVEVLKSVCAHWQPSESAITSDDGVGAAAT